MFKKSTKNDAVVPPRTRLKGSKLKVERRHARRPEPCPVGDAKANLQVVHYKLLRPKIFSTFLILMEVESFVYIAEDQS